MPPSWIVTLVVIFATVLCILIGRGAFGLCKYEVIQGRAISSEGVSSGGSKRPWKRKGKRAKISLMADQVLCEYEGRVHEAVLGLIQSPIAAEDGPFPSRVLLARERESIARKLWENSKIEENYNVSFDRMLCFDGGYEDEDFLVDCCSGTVCCVSYVLSEIKVYPKFSDAIEYFL